MGDEEWGGGGGSFLPLGEILDPSLYRVVFVHAVVKITESR